MDDDEELAFRFRQTTEYAVTATPAAMARLLGVSKAALRKFVDDGDDAFLEKVDDDRMAKLAKRRDAEVDAEEFEFIDLDVA